MRTELFYKIVFFLICLIIVVLLADYNMNWIHPEAIAQIGKVLGGNNSSSLSQLLMAFDYKTIHGEATPRLLTSLLQIINIKFRVWLNNYLPLHPSLNLTWMFSLLFAPVFLYKLTYNLTFNRTAAWVSVLLYSVSTGFLSGLTFMASPGKPLANFLAIFTLYLASEINTEANNGDVFSKHGFRLYIILLLALFISFFIDEVCWFTYACIPLTFPNIFFKKYSLYPKLTNKKIIIFSYISIFVLFLVFLTFVIPQITRYLGFGDFPFWKFGIMGSTRMGGPAGNPIWLNLQFFPLNAILNGHFLFASQLIPFDLSALGFFYKLQNENSWFFLHELYRADYLHFLYSLPVYLLLGGSFYYSYKKLAPNEKKLILRFSVVIILYILFHTLIFARNMIIVRASYYYGALFSVFLILPLSILLAVNTESAIKGVINKVILLLVVAVSISNFHQVNVIWRDHHTESYKISFPEQTKQMQDNNDTKLTYSLVNKAWNNKNDTGTLLGMKPQFHVRSVWLFVELEYVKRKNP